VHANNGRGVYLAQGGSVTNGGAKNTGAIIAGYEGIVAANAAATVRNFGLVSGIDVPGGYGAQVLSGGSLTNGSATDLKATIEGGVGAKLGGGASGVNFATIAGVGGYGAILGSGDTLINGGASDRTALIDGNGGIAVYGASVLTNFGTIDGGSKAAVDFHSSSAALVVEAGSSFVGTVFGDAGTLELASGVGTITGLFDGGDLTVSGSMAATTFTDFATLVTGAGTQFSDGGLVNLAANQTVQAQGALSLGGPLRNEVINAGLIESFSGGSITLAGAVVNNGLLVAHGGVITAIGGVSGVGAAIIAGGTLDTTAAFAETVTFSGGGVLELGQSQTYSGVVSGFSKTGATAFDLLDVGFVSASEATFAGTKTGGVLTVSDGTHTAHISLAGNYLASTWVAASDGHGGVRVVDPPAGAAATPSANAFVAAMASLTSPAGAAVTGGGVPVPVLQQALATPRSPST
jgi:hypothetical protein